MHRRSFFTAAAIATAGASDILVGAGSARGMGAPSAQASPPLDLNAVSPKDQIEAIRHVQGGYVLEMRDGRTLRYAERDLRIKTDGSASGPRPGSPALIKSGMSGDRAYVVFAAPHEISAFITADRTPARTG